MSKNRNRANFNKAQTSREYTYRLKHYYNCYCYICARRCGNFYGSCSPADMNAKGVHGSNKRIYTYKYREFKTWKYNRKTRWK